MSMTKAEEILIEAKVSLIRGFPFLSFVVMSTKYEILPPDDIKNLIIKTMAATVRGGTPVVLINEKFLMGTNDPVEIKDEGGNTVTIPGGLATVPERAFVIAHELLHIFLLHLGRQREYNYRPKLWNIATDYCINGYLVSMENDLVQFPKFGGLLDRDKYGDKGADEIYQMLLEEAEKIGNEMGQGKCQTCDGSGKKPEQGNDKQEGSGGQGGENEDGDQSGQGNGSGQGEEECPDCGGSGQSPASALERGVQEIYRRHGMTGEGGSNVWDDLESEGAGQLSEEQKAQLKAQLAASLQNSKDMGTGKGNALIDALQELLEPTIPWKELLRDYVIRAPQDRITYNKYNRRSGGVIFPSIDGDDHINCLVGVDTSGSMGAEELREALTEIKSITDTFGSWEMELVCCDTYVVPVGHYGTEEGDDFGDLSTAWEGGGGTDMNPIVQYAEDLDEEPDVIIIITDGYVPPVQGSYEIPVIIVVTSSGNEDFENNGCQVVKMNK